ncbi:DUF58 domain-containing protein [Streptomyces sp. V4-01]|uniref:DUF58 domain-containing protein n=1 Tax=Actinacidiphila polyblastidii TaxID=3110430 RepID=A0ABU7PLM6_9ACTN|nr:DUF58 domain-containing protein [Streptomyces sp. V4-01]
MPPDTAARVRLTGAGRWTAGVGTAATVLGGAGGQSPVFAFGVAALAACAGAWTSQRVGRRPRIVPEPPPAASYTRGEPLTVRWAGDGTRTRRVGPLTVHAALHGVLPDGGQETVGLTPGLGPRAAVPALPRGVWRLGPAVAEYRDTLGLAVRRAAPSSPSGPFTVRPRTAGDLPWIAEAHDAHASGAARLDTDDAFEIRAPRPFLPGDDLRFVDHRASLLTGAYQVREVRGGGSAPAVVLLDTAACGAEFETAVDCAAAVAVGVLRLGRPVLLCGAGAGAARGGDVLRVDPAPGAADHVLDLYARVRTRPDASPATLARTVAGLGGGALAVLATPRDPAVWRPALTALSARRATVICLHATRAASADAPQPAQAPGFRVVRVASVEDLAAPLIPRHRGAAAGGLRGGRL